MNDFICLPVPLFISSILSPTLVFPLSPLPARPLFLIIPASPFTDVYSVQEACAREKGESGERIWHSAWRKCALQWVLASITLRKLTKLNLIKPFLAVEVCRAVTAFSRDSHVCILQMPALQCYIEMEQRGCMVDVSQLVQLESDLDKRLMRVHNVSDDVGGAYLLPCCAFAVCSVRLS